MERRTAEEVARGDRRWGHAVVARVGIVGVDAAHAWQGRDVR